VKAVRPFACKLLIYIKDSPYTTIRKVFPVKMTEPRSGAVVSNTVLFLLVFSSNTCNGKLFLQHIVT
jgi:hypothetical protein